VSFSRTNCAETKAKANGVLDEDGNEMDFSDLDLAIGSGTGSQGNSLRAVAEYARKSGISLEKDCPYTTNPSQRQAIFNAAKNKKKYKLGNWSWVNADLNALKSALEDGPVQVGVLVGYNWFSGGVIKNPGGGNGHGIELEYIDELGQKYIKDSYVPYQKVLDKNYPIMMAMSFKDLPENWRGINVENEKFYMRLLNKLIIRPQANGEVYRIMEDRMLKVQFNISDKDLFIQVTKALRDKNSFLGVSEADFERLKTYAFEAGNGIVEGQPLTGDEILQLLKQ
jgi:hypothetical protein